MNALFPFLYKIELDDYILMRAVVSMCEHSNCSETLLQSYSHQTKHHIRLNTRPEKIRGQFSAFLSH